MKKIPLSKGFVALVDDEDFEELSKTKWCYSSGYAHRKYGPKKSQTTVLMHRQVARVPAGRGIIVDHINCNRLDNRKANLRIVTQVENQRNRPLKNRNNTTGITGVWFHNQNKNWCAEIMVRRKKINLGSFPTKEVAVFIRKAAEVFYFGEYAHKKIHCV